MSSPFCYPVALDIRGRRCVVVGAGAVGARKAAALREAGADVVALSLETTGPFVPAHLDGAFLAVAATDDPSVNAAVAAAARARGVLVNLAAPGDADDAGDFAAMAAVRRGDLLVGIATGGAGPALAAALRRELEARFGPAWEGYVNLLGRMRMRAKVTIAGRPERVEALRRLAESEAVRARALAGDLDGAQEEAIRCLS